MWCGITIAVGYCIGTHCCGTATAWGVGWRGGLFVSACGVVESEPFDGCILIELTVKTNSLTLSLSLTEYSYGGGEWKKKTVLERERVNLRNEVREREKRARQGGYKRMKDSWVGFVNAVDVRTVGLNDLGFILTIGFRYALYYTVKCCVSVSVPGSAARPFFPYPRYYPNPLYFSFPF